MGDGLAGLRHAGDRGGPDLREGHPANSPDPLLRVPRRGELLEGRTRPASTPPDAPGRRIRSGPGARPPGKEPTVPVPARWHDAEARRATSRRPGGTDPPMDCNRGPDRASGTGDASRQRGTHRGGPFVLVLPTGPEAGGSQGAVPGSGPDTGRRLPPPPTGPGRTGLRPGGRSAQPDPPGDPGPHRPSTHARGDCGISRGHQDQRLRAAGGPVAGFRAVWGALGTPLAGRLGLCRFGRLQRSRSAPGPRPCLPGLRDPVLQRRPSL